MATCSGMGILLKWGVYVDGKWGCMGLITRNTRLFSQSFQFKRLFTENIGWWGDNLSKIYCTVCTPSLFASLSLSLSLASVALASLGKKKKADLINACNWLRVQSKINGNKIFFVVIVVALKKIIFLQSCCAGIPATPGLWEIVRALPLPRSTPLSHVKVSSDQPPISHFFLMRQAL